MVAHVMQMARFAGSEATPWLKRSERSMGKVLQRVIGAMPSLAQSWNEKDWMT
jgi:hypothetical protein